MPTRRTFLKIIQWTMLPLAVWFILVQPADVARIGAGAVRFHSVIGLAFVTIALVWTALYLGNGLASRRAPKLSAWARTVHRLMHKTLIWACWASR